MSILELILVGIGLSMDAATVSMTNGMVYKNIRKDQTLAMPILFGLFQGIMPLLGFFAGGLFADFISSYANILVFLILGFIGGKMLFDAFKNSKEEEISVDTNHAVLTYKLLFIQAIATSIDAFAVGVGFNAIGIEIYSASIIIALTTALCTLISIFIGKKFGDLFESKSQIIGGIILIIIAIKALI